MRHPFRVAAFVAVATVLVAAAWIRLPYYAIGPGPARSVTPQIRYDGRPRYDPTGALEMTTVSYHQVSPLQAIVAWLEPDWALVPQADLYPTGNVALENQRSISQMDQSKIDATGVVLRRLANYPKDHGTGALVESTVPDCSADGRLFPGDIIEAIDGKPVGDTADVVASSTTRRRGRPVLPARCGREGGTGDVRPEAVRPRRELLVGSAPSTRSRSRSRSTAATSEVRPPD
jgi:PDZ domain-containing protein